MRLLSAVLQLSFAVVGVLVTGGALLLMGVALVASLAVVGVFFLGIWLVFATLAAL